MRWTPVMYFRPNAFVEPEVIPDDFDVETWSEDFEFDNDPFYGLLDYVSPVEETLEAQSGDCDDYAAVVASWLETQDVEYDIVFCARVYPPIGHVFIADGTRTYSSGQINEETVDEFIERTSLDVVL